MDSVLGGGGGAAFHVEAHPLSTIGIVDRMILATVDMTERIRRVGGRTPRHG